jgi:uncharacterized membrane protein
MLLLLLIVLALVTAHLWTQLEALRRRIEMLEFASARAAEPSPTFAPVEAADRGAAVEPDLAPEPEILPEPAPPPLWRADAAETPRPEDAPRLGFEDIFGRRLPIWAGGITLAVAGFLIVKYSIQAGLLSPATRVILGLLFGGALIAGAEAALRAKAAIRDVRIPQALSGAGIATWFAAILVAADLYHLVTPMTAFVGMAVVTACAALLSLRFGAPSAVLGLLGGLAAPALVGSAAPNVPLLSLYLALTVGGLSALSRRQRWWWLGAMALTGGFGWGLLLIFGGLLDLSQRLSIGLLTLALAAALPLLLVGGRARLVRLLAIVVGCAQMAALVALGGFSLVDWGLLGLLSIAALWLSRREPALGQAPAIALGVALSLGAAWPGPSGAHLSMVLTGIALIHMLPAALRVWRPDRQAIDAPLVGVSTLAMAILPVLHFPHLAPLQRALPPLIGAAMAAAVAGWGWIDRARCAGARFAILTGAAAAALALADAVGLAGWTLPPAVALLALALQLLGLTAANRRMEMVGWVFGWACLVILLTAPDECLRWIGTGGSADWLAFARWGVPAAVAAAFALAAPRPIAMACQALGALLLYSACAQVVPALWLPIVPALLVGALALPGRASLLPAIATGAALSIGWAIAPLAAWHLNGAIAALTGAPFAIFPSDFAPALRRLAVPALMIGVAVLRLPLARAARVITVVGAGWLGLVAAHIAYRQIIVIHGTPDLVARGMMERTVWEIALAAAAAIAWRLRKPRVALAVGGAALGHFIWFTLLLHNPFWFAQDVGPWLMPAYATAFFLVWASGRLLASAERPRNWAMMGLIALFAFSALRQIAHGAMPLRLGVDAREDIARSVLAILLAIGFLRFGIARTARDWRIASLALMLVAVGKVFLLDAAGLDGLLRIASFAALGLSLMGVGWLYSRYLPDASR